MNFYDLIWTPVYIHKNYYFLFCTSVIVFLATDRIPPSLLFILSLQQTIIILRVLPCKKSMSLILPIFLIMINKYIGFASVVEIFFQYLIIQKRNLVIPSSYVRCQNDTKSSLDFCALKRKKPPLKT